MKQFFKSFVVAVLTFEAKLVLKKYKPKVIAVTGNVGKTSAKDALYALLAGFFHTRKSEKSFNSDVGVPLSILGCPNGWNNPFVWLRNFWRGALIIIFRTKYPDMLVLEVGADRPGDIKRVAEWLRPDVVVVTRMSKVPVHIEFFRDAAELAKEKSFLVSALRDGGLLVLNADDAGVMAFADAKRDRRLITFGIEPGADFFASHIEVAYKKAKGEGAVPSGMAFRVNRADSSVPVRIGGSLGRTHVYPVLSAFAVGGGIGLDLADMGEKFSEYAGPNGRMKILGGVKQTTLIDDTYNSSPLAAEEALSALGGLVRTGKKIAVLGDMLELGKHSVAEHKKLGSRAAAIADVLVTVGLRARGIAEGALDAGLNEGKIFQFDEAREAGAFLENILAPGDVVLVKGSQGVRMERFVEEVMAHPEDKEKLLVRQDLEWRKR